MVKPDFPPLPTQLHSSQGYEWYRRQVWPTSKSGLKNHLNLTVSSESKQNKGRGNQTPRAEVIVEKTPSYFVTHSSPERVRAMNSSIKILLVVRDPVTRLLSDYSQLAAKWRYQRWSRRMQMRGSGGGELHLPDGSLDTSGFSTSPPSQTDGNLLDFEQFVTRRENNQANNSRVIDDENEAVSRSTYVRHMRKWLDKFKPNQIHVISGEQLVRNPWTELRKVENFLGLPREISKDNFQFVPSKGFYCLKVKTGAQQERHQGIKLSEQPTYSERRKYVKCLAKTKGRVHPKVSQEFLHKLRKFFRPYNFQFYDMTGHDHGWPDD